MVITNKWIFRSWCGFFLRVNRCLLFYFAIRRRWNLVGLAKKSKTYRFHLGKKDMVSMFTCHDRGSVWKIRHYWQDIGKRFCLENPKLEKNFGKNSKTPSIYSSRIVSGSRPLVGNRNHGNLSSSCKTPCRLFVCLWIGKSEAFSTTSFSLLLVFLRCSSTLLPELNCC